MENLRDKISPMRSLIDRQEIILMMIKLTAGQSTEYY